MTNVYPLHINFYAKQYIIICFIHIIILSVIMYVCLFYYNPIKFITYICTFAHLFCTFLTHNEVKCRRESALRKNAMHSARPSTWIKPHCVERHIKSTGKLLPLQPPLPAIAKSATLKRQQISQPTLTHLSRVEF